MRDKKHHKIGSPPQRKEHIFRKMPLIKDQRLFESLSQISNLKAFRAITKSKNFQYKFEGSVSSFFKSLKNGLNSIGSLSNRKYFRNLSGCYFALDNSDTFEIIIFYDESKTPINQFQIASRVKKLLGFGSDVEFGDFSHFRDRAEQILSIQRKTQTFGDFFFRK